MGTWALLPTDQLWRYALAAIPLTLAIAMVARCLPCRPATRHGLWLFVLIWLVVGPMLPAAPRIDMDPVLDRATTWLVAESEPGDEGLRTEPPTSRAGKDVSARISSTGGSETIHQTAAVRSAARLRLDDGPSTPFSLAQAIGLGGSPTGIVGLPTVPSDTSPVSPRLSSSVGPTRGAVPLQDKDPAVTPASIEPPRSSVRATKAVPARRPHAIAAQDAAIPLPAKVPADDSIEDRVQPSSAASDSSWMATTRDWVASLTAVRDSIGRLPAMPAGLWLGGTIMIGLLACIRVLRFQSLLAEAVPAPGSVRQLVAREAASMKLHSVPEALFVKRRVSPMIWCGRRVRLILPVALWAQLDEIGRRAVVLHELAHVRRRDHWVSRVELLVGAIYWWYPLVWWVRGRMHAEAEECCDAWVTSLLPRDRRAYAEALLRTKQYVRTSDQTVPLLGIGITNGRAGRFARRLKMVMTRSVRPGRSLPGTALVTIVAAATWFAAPAQSCPDDAKGKASASAAPSATVVSVVGASSDCGKGKQGDPCGKCRKVAEACSKCKSGKGCEGCKSGAPCKLCVKSFSLGSKSGSTFETYLAARGAGKSAYADTRKGLEYALAIDPAIVQVVGFGDGERDLEERMERLEKRLERLGEQLERMAEDGGRHKAKSRRGREARAPRAPRTPRAPRAPRARRAPRAPRPPKAPPAPPAPHPPHADHFFGPGDDSGKTVIRSYELPEGKLKALTALMARDDIPVLISPRDGSIEVHGTARQHRIFQAFVDIIHPKGKSRGRRSEMRFVPAPEDGHGIRRIMEVEAARHAHAAAEHAHQAALHEHEVAVREALAAQHGQARQRAQQMQLRRNAVRPLQIERKVLREQMRQIERESDLLRDRAEDMLDAAEEMREEAEEMREQAEDLRGEIEDAGDDERMALMTEAEKLLATALDLDREAKAREREGGLIERKAEEIQEQAELLEVEAERMESEVEEIETRVSQQHDSEG